ncbi:MAG: carbohydrate ABC transporter substrate-binding protein, partial [Trueperaceae bacterium]
TVDADTETAQQFVEYLLTDAYLDWLSFAPEGLFPVRRGTPDNPTQFVDGWADLPVGVDRKAPLSDFYPPDVISAIVAGMDVANRWGFSQGQGALVGRLYGTRVMSELVREFIDGERSAEETAALLQLEVEALQ